MSEFSSRTGDLSPAEIDLLVRRLRKAGKGTPSEGKPAPSPPRIPRVDRAAGRFPLSFGQEQLWFLDRLRPGLPAYNLPSALRLRGRLSVPALAASLSGVAQRHEALRTRVELHEDHPFQVVEPPSPIPLPVTDLSALPAAVREAETARLAVAEGARPFDLAAGPLVRAGLLRLGPEEHVLLVTLHHIGADAWSVGLFIRELAELYAAAHEGRASTLPEPPAQFVDFAAWQRDRLTGENRERLLAIWRERLAGSLAPLDLPADRVRPPIPSYRGARFPLALEPGLGAGVGALARSAGATPFMTLLAAFAALLHRYTASEGRDRLAIGSPVASRGERELEGMIGLLLNTLVLPFDLGGEVTGRALLERTRDTALAAFAHQEMPFPVLVEGLQPARDLSRNPLFQVLFALRGEGLPALTLPGLTLEPLSLDPGTAQFDLTLNLVESGGGWEGWLEYSTDLFDAASAERMAGHFREIVRGLVADPERRVSELPLLTAAERGLLAAWNDTGVDFSAECIHERIEARVDLSPGETAVISGERELSYAELDRRANQLARRLRRLGAGPGRLVAVCVRRSPGMVVALLGVLKSGAAYVPLDPEYPRERLAWMLDDAHPVAVLLEQDTEEVLPERGVPRVRLDDSAGEADSRPAVPVSPDDLAYVIYTSGSTGRPKGVMVSHRNAVGLFAGIESRFGDGDAGTWLAVTSISFDISVLELLWPLTRGARIVVHADRQGRIAPLPVEELTVPQAIRRHGVSWLQSTPSMIRMLASDPEGLPALRTLRRLLLGGEALPEDLAGLLRRELPGVEIHNLYGPTEATVWSTAHRIEKAGEPVSIGAPLANERVLVLDGRLQPLPVGVPGELWLGGAGIARGYLERPDLTAERFLPDSTGAPGARMYRTGDLARWRPDGTLEFLGRVDHQVKVRGHRIELGEIEAVLRQHPGIAQAVLAARLDGAGETSLAAWVVPADADGPGEPGAEATASALRRFLQERLPDFMIPAAFVTLPALPLTPNGKVDRRALPAPDGRRPDLDAAYVPPSSETEERIAGLWREVLQLDRVGVHDNFFEVGGTSLSLVRVHAALSRSFEPALSLVDLFRNPTIAALAARLAGAGEARVALGEVEDRGRQQADALRQGAGAVQRQKDFLAERRQRRLNRR